LAYLFPCVAVEIPIDEGHIKVPDVDATRNDEAYKVICFLIDTFSENFHRFFSVLGFWHFNGL
jgi:hypothetical protein